jgi:SSS family solute:Na+ symporter
MIGVSYATPEPDPAQIKSLTFGTATDEDRAKTRASWGPKEVLASLVVLVCILGAYIYFRG